MNLTNSKEIRVFGLKRSGNHAIINWLFFQIPNIVVFLNNCYPAGKKLHLYTGKGQINCKGVDYWDFKRKFFFLEPNPFQDKLAVEYSREDKRLNREKLKQFPKEALIISFEDKDINKMNTMIDNDHDELVGKSRDIFYIIILRDPFNLLASYYKKWGEKRINTIVMMWKNYAHLFLKYEQISDFHFLGINYNKWVTDVAYRKEITEKLGIPFDDSAKKRVANFGGGSSFDELSYQGSADEMDVFTRWKAFKDDKIFRQLFQDQEMVELAHKIFRVIPETESLLSVH